MSCSVEHLFSLEDFLLGHCLEDVSLLEKNVLSLERLVDTHPQESLKYGLELLSILYLEEKVYQRAEMSHRVCVLLDECVYRLATPDEEEDSFNLGSQVKLGKTLVSNRRYKEALILYEEIELHLQLEPYQSYPLEVKDRRIIPRQLLEKISPVFDDLVLCSAMAFWRTGQKTSHILSMWMDSSHGHNKNILSQLHWFLPKAEDVFPPMSRGRVFIGSFVWKRRCCWTEGEVSSLPAGGDVVEKGSLQLLTLNEEGREYGRLFSEGMVGEIFNLV